MEEPLDHPQKTTCPLCEEPTTQDAIADTIHDFGVECCPACAEYAASEKKKYEAES